MKYTTNDLRKTFTVEYKEMLYFRVDIYRIKTGDDIQIGGYFSEVYMLLFPHGAMASTKETMDHSFRQQWLYLEDFPRCNGGGRMAVESDVLKAVEAYGDAYLSKFSTSLKRQKVTP